MRTRRAIAGLCGVAWALAGCGGGDGGGGATTEPLRVTSPDVRGGELARRLTCDGAGASPTLEWSAAPGEAAALAILVEDLDAPGGRYLHWSVWGLAPQTRSLIGEGPAEGRASSGDRGWEPPCPPRGDPAHRYRFEVLALREAPRLRPGAAPDAARRAIRELAVAGGALTARYAR